MPDSPKRPTLGELLYGPSGPRDSRGPDNRGFDNREAPPKWDWVERLRWRIGPEWTAGGPWDQRR